jgi:dTDP-glucose 4,6-dehydratase
MKETIRWYLDNQQWWTRVKSGAYQDFYQRWYGEQLNNGKVKR